MDVIRATTRGRSNATWKFLFLGGLVADNNRTVGVFSGLATGVSHGQLPGYRQYLFDGVCGKNSIVCGLDASLFFISCVQVGAEGRRYIERGEQLSASTVDGQRIFFWNFQDDRLGPARVSICSFGHCYEAAVVRAVHQSRMFYNIVKDCPLDPKQLAEVVEEHVTTEPPHSWPIEGLVGKDEIEASDSLATDRE